MKIDSYKTIELYAKRFKKDNQIEYQTIYQHTMDLLNNMDKLFEEYREDIEEGCKKLQIDCNKFEYLLRLAIIYHDLGKANSKFQQKIRDKAKINEVPQINNLSREVPHNFISIAFVDLEDEIEKGNINSQDFENLLFTIAFSHDRSFDFDCKYFEKYINDDVAKYLENESLNPLFNLLPSAPDKDKILENSKYFYRLITKLRESMFKEQYDFSDKNVIFRILLKGFLHRLDHSSSAGIIAEEIKIQNFPKKVEFYLKNKGKFAGFKDFQKKAIELSGKNVILFAPTGSGKTEFGLNWASKSKLIYTLPIRVSINAMYERLAKVFGEDKVGILHSDSTMYLIEKYMNSEHENQELETLFDNIDLAKNLSLPVIVTTGDQIFTSALKWPGFEKIYSLFLYSKIIIDEPQSYSPESLAIIIKTLEEIINLNGKFCLMSATINPIILKYIGKYAEYVQAYSDEDLKKMYSHIVSIKELTILDCIDEVIENGKRKNVLVICNTVKRAQEVYQAIKESLKNSEEIPVELLHSRFLEGQKRQKEQIIMSNQRKNGIVISTQLVEASLDIDYDILFTELASADSLLQRMGRIYRKRTYNDLYPNIIILTKDPSGVGKIYQKDIVDRTEEFLKDFHGNKITEYDKKRLNEYAYNVNALEKTRFINNFNKAYELLKLGYRADRKIEAQKIFRDIVTISGIPKEIFDRNFEEINETLKKIKTRSLKSTEKLKLIFSIRKYTVTVPAYFFTNGGVRIYDKDSGIYILDCEYDNELGLIPPKTLEQSDIW
ncbi:CRISPR-associated helicase Cas3' [Fervidobacterium sp. 2310opik-2]|uniref:CRISPR-associated helicase Cas3' n=1 Tax=Fervidobacterium sp. 2310opik-2 TaxID=1755815 RepID=UPI0013DEBCE8|nr:CRISPR-associated helicase Cas3' [Fervidobacterium sp. 2310opik-2]KAF2960849.1 CRISPR-associated protein Cas3 [Fervidobacterium sp. 2310opik-2]